MSCWLVTGATGFLGRPVVAALQGGTAQVSRLVSLTRQPVKETVRGLDWVQADLADDVDALIRLLAAVQPDVVIHCAGTTPPQTDPTAFEVGNVRATANLLDTLRELGRPVRLIQVGSAAELGPVPVDRLPVDESYPCEPTEAYGRSKLAAMRLALAASGPLSVVGARVFNPIGPGMPPGNAFGRFARLLATPGADPLQLQVGDLAARRDFIDVRDVATALIALAEGGRAGMLYHVGTGQSQRVGDGLEQLIALSGRRVEVHASGPGPGPSDSRAAIERLQADTGWSPRITWEQSLADLWADVRASVSNA